MTVTFNDPRRFGVMDLLSANGRSHTAIERMGPEPLSAAFDAATLAAGCTGRRTSLKVALLDQRVVAGLGNIYASEALHVAHLSPHRLATTIATASGRPRPGAVRLAAAIKSVLRRAISSKESASYRGTRFRVYDREGEGCPTKGCRGTIERVWQAGRSPSARSASDNVELPGYRESPPVCPVLHRRVELHLFERQPRAGVAKTRSDISSWRAVKCEYSRSLYRADARHVAREIIEARDGVIVLDPDHRPRILRASRLLCSRTSFPAQHHRLWRCRASVVMLVDVTLFEILEAEVSSEEPRRSILHRDASVR
jgi:hypothetical protein